MDAAKIFILNDFIALNRIFFKIPVYQRSYTWQVENCEQLAEDLEKILFKEKEKHFLGSIVYLKEKAKGTTFQDLIIIDGQQRLITLLIFLKALDNFYQENELAHFFYNRSQNLKERIKLKAVQADQEDIYLLFANKAQEINKQKNLYKNYKFFLDKIASWLKRENIKVEYILQALKKLEAIEIVLDKDEDDAQIIFERINATGLDLSETDLIRNFLLMNEEKQDEFYEKYWLYIENKLRINDDYRILDEFFAAYLKSKVGSNLQLRKLYEEFIFYFKERKSSKEELFKELKYFCDIFLVFIGENSTYSKNINLNLQKIRDLKVSSFHPFLLKVFGDYHEKLLNEEALEKIVNLLFIYLLRRKVCEIPSNSLPALFTTLYNKIFKVPSNKENYYESINLFLFSLENNDAFPSDENFKKALLENNLYNKGTFCQFLLSDIEATSSKELLEFENLTIEHIMPQTLNANWKHIPAKEHKKYLNTLGNLTLTAYNSSLSNRAFLEKKAMILDKSRVLILNQDLKDKESWKISDIQERGERLASLLLEKYSVKKIEDEKIHFDFYQTLTLFSYKEVSGAKLISFKFDGKTYPKNYFTLMLLEFALLLNKKFPGILSKLAKENFAFLKSKKILLSKNPELLSKAFELKEGIFIERTLAPVYILRAIEALLREVDIDPMTFSITVLRNSKESDFQA